MPKKPRRFTARDRRQQILEVAMGLFARQGFKGTTTRQIAERAGVNEALIFRHYPSKEDLYWAIIEAKCRIGRRRAKILQELQSGRTDWASFSAIAEDILQRNREDNTVSRLLLFSALENHRLSQRFFRTYVARNYEVLADHVRRRIREGSFRRVNPLVAARGFLGMVIYHFLIQEIFGGKRYQKFNPKKVSSTLADIWLYGMQNPRRGRVRKK